MIIAPFTTCCGYEGTFSKFNMLPINPKMSTPINVFIALPLPPFKLAPPITMAAMASSSQAIPIFGDPKLVLEATITAAVAAKAPEIAYTKNLYLYDCPHDKSTKTKKHFKKHGRCCKCHERYRVNINKLINELTLNEQNKLRFRNRQEGEKINEEAVQDFIKNEPKPKHNRIWTIDEDEDVIRYVHKKMTTGVRNFWKTQPHYRYEKRWRNKINPKFKRTPFTDEEDRLILTAKKLARTEVFLSAELGRSLHDIH